VTAAAKGGKTMKPENQPRTVHVGQCAYCGGGNIVRKIHVDQTADAGSIGLPYHTRFIVTGVEPLYADLCDDCGSVVRIYVDGIGKRWVTK
jgi:hypothetical protein